MNPQYTNVFTNENPESNVEMESNLVVFGPPYGTKAPANIREMLTTNGLECWVCVSSRVPTYGDKPLAAPPVCYVYVYNHSTNDMTCLRMPATNLCQIALLDKQGHQVEKTKSGKMYGEHLSQDQIEARRHNWRAYNQSIFINMLPDGDPQSQDMPTEICELSVKNAFQIAEAGEYELHLQLRLVQIAKDSSGKFCYPVTWLPEVTAKVQIQPKDISPTNSTPLSQTNSQTE